VKQRVNPVRDVISNGVKSRHTQRQVSAGGVTFKKLSSSIRICLIGRRNLKDQMIWCLPKGHIEKGETFKRAALREVREETGISGTILSGLGSIRYSFFDLEDKRKIFKTVHFFLIQYVKGKLSDHDDEVEYARWFAFEKAIRLMSYEGERNVFKRAIKKIRLLK